MNGLAEFVGQSVHQCRVDHVHDVCRGEHGKVTMHVQHIKARTLFRERSDEVVHSKKKEVMKFVDKLGSML